MKNPLSSYKIARENIRQKPFRALCIFMVITIFTFALIVGSVLLKSMTNGLKSMSNRLGADIMVVPDGFDPHIDSILLTGKPSNFYLPSNALEKLKQIEGIELASPQTYLATLKASCCSYPVQLVGIDNKTDFIIKPWLGEALSRELKDGNVIVGYHIEGELGDKINFFGKEFKISGKLNQTGMAFDSTVFMTRESIAKLAVEAERIAKHPLSKDGSLISTIMVKVKPGFDSTKVSKEINSKLNSDGIYALFSKRLVNQVNGNLSVISNFIKIIVSFVWIIAVVMIALIYALSFNERKKEFGVLRILGATRAKILRISLLEVLNQAFYASLFGAAAALITLAVISPNMVEALKVPFLMPEIKLLMLIVILSLFISIASSLLAAMLTVVKISKNEVLESMRSNE